MKRIFALALAASFFPLASHAKSEIWAVDTAASSVKWEATKIGGGHHGHVNLKSGKLITDKGGLTGGDFVADMKSIAIEDDMGAEMNKKLDTHLRSDDFFSVEKNPTASLKINKAEPAKKGIQEITADLTIKGITKPVTFPATIKNDGNSLEAKAEFQVDRTAYDIKYRSLKFFADLGDKVIHDKFTLKIDLKARK